MSLLETEQRRSRRAQRKHRNHVKRKHQKQRKHKHRSALDAPLALSSDHQVLTFREWCALSRISERTGRRILASGNGPTVTQLSDRRIGISIANNRRWQESRERA
jgi:hypothetical protein